MRVLVQRVLRASVQVSGSTVGAIDSGLLLLVGFTTGDGDKEVAVLAEKVVNLRIFADDKGKLQHSVLQTGGGILAVPQFTLYAGTARGRRPDFTVAMEPNKATTMFDLFVKSLAEVFGKPVQTGIFGADMKVELVNDGPFTIMLSREPSPNP